MAVLIPGVDTMVMANEPTLEVLASPAQPLAAGRHVIQLVVTDNAGNQSGAASMAITVKDRSKPSALIDFVQEDGTRLYDDSRVVAYGKPFRLTGERSSDANGLVKSWRWTLISP